MAVFPVVIIELLFLLAVVLAAVVNGSMVDPDIHLSVVPSALVELDDQLFQECLARAVLATHVAASSRGGLPPVFISGGGGAFLPHRAVTSGPDGCLEVMGVYSSVAVFLVSRVLRPVLRESCGLPTVAG